MERRKRGAKCIVLTGIILCAAAGLGGCQWREVLEQVPWEAFLQIDSGEEAPSTAESAATVREPEKRLPGEVQQEGSGEVEERAAEVRELSLEEIETVGNAAFLRADGSGYAYEKLNDIEKVWYRDIEWILGTMSEGVKLSEEGLQAGLDEDEVDKIFQCVLCDHPELFFVEGYTYTKYTREDKTVAIEFSGACSLDKETAWERKQEIDAAVEALLRNAPRNGTDYEKARYVYETLILNTDYNVTSEDNQNIYSVFVNRASVCQGYAKAAQYLLNRLGIFCTLVQGRVLGTGEGHAWNLVKLDGDYYYLDTTWGDISYQNMENGMDKSLPQISYDYLCITTEQLKKTHGIESLVAMPVCTATKDNYYVRENALFARYDEEKLSRLADAAQEAGRGMMALRCTNEECYRQMREKLIEQQEIFRYLSGAGSFVYTENNEQWTLTFFLVTSE